MIDSFESPGYSADGHGPYTCNGILFNHESLRRGETLHVRPDGCLRSTQAKRHALLNMKGYDMNVSVE